MRTRTTPLLVLAALAAAAAASAQPEVFLITQKHKSRPIPAGYKLVYDQDFEGENPLKDFVMTDPAAWRITTHGNTRALDQFAQSKYKPPVRSPVNIGLIADKVFGDFILEADLLSTAREYGHRDLCIFFGAQSPAKFHYVHIATKADPHAHNIFIVDDAPRRAIARETTGGIQWGDRWHKVRIERDTSEGAIRVFFDDMSEPVMVAEDTTLTWGYIGFGSFDDTGLFDNLRIWAPSIEDRKTGFYRRPE